MRIIPVIDLRDQRAVRGASGDRERYRPVASRLRGPREEDLSDPVALVRAYGEELEATTIYVADLDRLEGRGSHDALVPRLLDSAPGARFLWDAGLTGADSLPRALRPAVDAGRLAPILATETLASLQGLAPWPPAEARRAAWPAEAGPVLGLDLEEEGVVARAPDVAAQDDAALLRLAARRGLREAILLSLRRVGTGRGLPRERLLRLRREAPGLRLHAGGGIGSAADLDFLQRAGFAGALVAGALHDGSLTPHRLRQGGWLG